MRELLFRGFHPCDGPDTIVVDKEKVNGKWVEGSLLTYKDGTTFVCCEDYIPDVLNKYEVLLSTVGQYTGLKDRKGTRIFEGDIVRRETAYYGKHNVYDEPVVWEDDIENDSFGEPYTSGYCIHGGNWEVIGTVFDEVHHE